MFNSDLSDSPHCRLHGWLKTSEDQSRKEVEARSERHWRRADPAHRGFPLQTDLLRADSVSPPEGGLCDAMVFYAEVTLKVSENVYVLGCVWMFYIYSPAIILPTVVQRRHS